MPLSVILFFEGVNQLCFFAAVEFIGGCRLVTFCCFELAFYAEWYVVEQKVECFGGGPGVYYPGMEPLSIAFGVVGEVNFALSVQEFVKAAAGKVVTSPGKQIRRVNITGIVGLFTILWFYHFILAISTSQLNSLQ